MRTPRSFDAWLEARLSRRALLVGGLALSGLPIVRGRAVARTFQSPGATPFTLGVASGDPTDTGVVLWTRLAPEPLHGGGMAPVPVEVIWELGTDDRMSSPLRVGRTTAAPEWAHSVHVEVDGLEPDRWYWYRFRAGGAESAIGRTRTLPRAGAPVDRLRFAFCSCQHYEDGYFTAYRHLAEEPLDLVFHLGDYIYEGRGRPGRAREHLGADILTIDDYRIRHAQYRLDADLQAAHASCPWVLTWDDHEVVNNYANDVARDTDPRALFLLRRAAAYQAYYEHMPLRRASMPEGPSLRLYRQFAYGGLASFFVLDTRQYRTDQPCGDGNKVPCDAARDPSATLLGPEQSRWLFEGLDRSRARWHVLPQQIMMAKVDQFAGAEARYSMDQWPGYDVERTRVLDFLRTRRPSNPVVLTGDIHSNWVNDLKVDHADEAAPIVATEFVGTSITSGGDGSDTSGRTATVLAENPFVKFHNTQRGYVSCEITPQSMRASYRIVDYVSRPGSPLRTRATFLVADGKPGAQRE